MKTADFQEEYSNWPIMLSWCNHFETKFSYMALEKDQTAEHS